jgi:diaminopimelate decarboxylase
MALLGRTEWWQRADIRYINDVLFFGQHNVFDLAQQLGTPLYLYSGDRAIENLNRLHRALNERAIAHRIFYAMKSNRYAPLLTDLRIRGDCGIDACSPQEVRRARQVGFLPRDISFTATAISETDLNELCRQPDLIINCDSLSTLRQIGQRMPGRSVGLRVNPGLGIGYRHHQLLRYSGSKPTKFGIYAEQLDEAIAIAQQYDMSINGLHFHTGCGYLTPQLEDWSRIIQACLWFLDRLPTATYVNVGGGLGIPLVEDDEPLDLDAWADVLVTHFGDRPQTVYIEPGDYIAKDAGILVLQVTMVEPKQNTWFIGVNGGFNLHIEPAFYQLPLAIVPAQRSPADPDWPKTVTVSGNINEALDVWAEQIPLPSVQEGDYLCFLNAGGYGASMRSNHCMRGEMTEVLLA